MTWVIFGLIVAVVVFRSVMSKMSDHQRDRLRRRVGDRFGQIEQRVTSSARSQRGGMPLPPSSSGGGQEDPAVSPTPSHPEITGWDPQITQWADDTGWAQQAADTGWAQQDAVTGWGDQPSYGDESPAPTPEPEADVPDENPAATAPPPPTQRRDWVGSSALESTLDSTIESSLFGPEPGPTLQQLTQPTAAPSLPREVEAAVLGLMTAGNEVGAVQAVQQAMDVGLVDAVRAVRNAAGLPSF